jgi:phosphoesterase RecJ-like protein
MQVISEDFVDFLSHPRKAVIISHWNPDGDAVGSSLGWAQVLANRGHQVQVVLPNNFPQFLLSFEGAENISLAEDLEGKLNEAFDQSDIVFTLDFNKKDRCGELLQKQLERIEGNIPICMVDHHIDPENYAKWTFSDTTKSSTCEMIWDLIVGLGWEGSLSKGGAEALYTGMMTDTGSFRYSSVKPSTHRAVAHLLEKGVQPEQIHERIFDQSNLSRLVLLGKCMQSMKVRLDLKLISFALSASDLLEAEYEKGDTEGFVNYGLSVSGIEISVLFIEREDGWKVSLRSVASENVNSIARELFEGGGHKNASGGRFIGELDEARNLLEAFLQNRKSEE